MADWIHLSLLPNELNFEMTLLRLRQRNSCLYRLLERGFQRVMTMGDGHCVVLRAQWDANEQVGTIDYYGVAADREEVGQKADRLLALDWPFQTLYAHMNTIGPLQPLVSRLNGYAPIAHPDDWECLVTAIIGQQLNIGFAATLNNRLIEAVGRTFELEGFSYPVFPAPSELLMLSVDALRERQFSTRKAEYVLGVAKAIVTGELDFDRLAAMNDEEALTTLISLRGVGRWTAECLLMDARRTDLLPAADIGLRNGVAKLYGLANQATEQQVRELAETWRPWRSCVTQYVWGAQLLPPE